MNKLFPVTLLILTGLAVQPVSAQQFPFGNKKGESPFDAQKTKIERKLGLRISDMNTTCDLSEAQIKKLKIASKGAAIEATKSLEKQMKKMMGGQFFVGPPNGPDDGAPDFGAPGDAPFEGEAEMPLDMIVQQGMDFEQMFGISVSGEETKIWKQTLKKTLTPEQSKKYENVVALRFKFKRKAAVQSFVAKTDSKLLLTEEQREKLIQFVDEKYGEDLAKSSALNAPPFILMGGQNNGAKVKKDSPLRKVLTKDQLSVWESQVAPELAMLGQEGGPFGAMGIPFGAEVEFGNGEDLPPEIQDALKNGKKR